MRKASIRSALPLAAFAVLACSMVTACGQTEAAAPSNDMRVAALETSVAELSAQVAEIRAVQPAVFITAPNDPTAVAAARSAARRAAGLAAAEIGLSPCEGLGTLTGRPTDGNPITTNRIAAVSCTGYLYVIDDSPSADGNARLMPPPANAVFFASADCTGTGYVSSNFGSGAISRGAYASGAVFLMGDAADPASYLYLPASGAAETVTAGSAWFDSACLSLPPSPVDSSVALVVNDPAVTGVPSAPIAGPIVIGTAGPG